MEENRKRLIMVVDFNNMAFSSYYGTHKPNSKGIIVDGVRAFFIKLKILKDAFDPDFLVFASDISRKLTFRRELYPPYKAQRRPGDPEMINQMKMISKIIGLLGFQTLNHPYYEADDILGMISRYAIDNNMNCILISSDRDMYQLVTDTVWVQSPRNNDLIDPTFIMNKYGLHPDQWIDLKCLQGDKSDNIPGIYGIGESTALQLMRQYGSLENIHNNLDNIPVRIRQCLITDWDKMPLTKQLVTIVTDYTKIDLTETMMMRRPAIFYEVMNTLDELELMSIQGIMRFSLLPQDTDKMQIFRE